MSNAADMLAAYTTAELALLKGQTYKFGERQLTMANLPEIQAGRREWEQRVNSEAARAAGIATRPGVRLANFSGCDE